MKATILITDDDITNLNILRDFLEDAEGDYKILRANNGKKACEIAQKATPDLIILDWEMPIMTGLEALHFLQNDPITQEIPVVMATAKTQAKDLQTALEAGAIDYVRKPIDKIELLARVNLALKLSNARRELKNSNQKLEQEKQKSDNLLLNILPREIAEELKTKGSTEIRRYDLVSVLFTDFVGFTQIASHMDAQMLVEQLNSYFAFFDEIIEKYNLEKIKTIGDSYMCAGGVPIANRSNPATTVLAGLEIQKCMQEQFPKQDTGWQLRLGINSGEVIAGVIGKKKYAYDLWGDTVNTASRIESNGLVNKVNISGNTYELVKDFFDCEYRGKINAKGKGEIDMYFVKGIQPELSEDGAGIQPNALFKQKVISQEG